MNDFDHIVDMRNFAVTDHAGYFNFQYTPIAEAGNNAVNIGGSRLEPGNATDNRTLIQVRTVALDEDLSQVSNVDWLRMDIEGAEILALKGAQTLLWSSPNIKIIMEWSLSNLRRLSNPNEFLIDMYGQGFRFYPITNTSMSNALSEKYMLKHGGGFHNYLLTRPNTYESLYESVNNNT